MLFGILSCPYRNECGSDSGIEFTYEFEEDEARKLCHTWRHFSCPIYISKKQDHPIDEPQQIDNHQEIHRES